MPNSFKVGVGLFKLTLFIRQAYAVIDNAAVCAGLYMVIIENGDSSRLSTIVAGCPVYNFIADAIATACHSVGIVNLIGSFL